MKILCIYASLVSLVPRQSQGMPFFSMHLCISILFFSRSQAEPGNAIIEALPRNYEFSRFACFCLGIRPWQCCVPTANICIKLVLFVGFSGVKPSYNFAETDRKKTRGASVAPLLTWEKI
jgi:hypothetical protein